MMDALDHLAAPGQDLLDRVDHLLAVAGAPAGHAVWPLVRRLRALPGDAAAAVVALQPGPLVTAGTALRELLPEYAALRAGLSAEAAWEGAAGAAFDAHRTALAAHLGDGPETLHGRLTATAEYAEAVAAWATGARTALARTLAEVLGSAEAAMVVTGQPRPVATGHSGSAVTEPPAAELAAAEIGARVLGTVAAAYDDAEALLERWRPALAELPYHAPAEKLAPLDAGLRIGR